MEKQVEELSNSDSDDLDKLDDGEYLDEEKEAANFRKQIVVEGTVKQKESTLGITQSKKRILVLKRQILIIFKSE